MRLNQLIKQYPNHAKFHLQLGRCKALQHQYPAAAEQLDLAIKAEPSDAAARQFRSAVRLKLKNLPVALEDLREVVRLSPDDPAARLRLAGTLKGAGLYNDAITIYEQAMKLAPAGAAREELVDLQLRRRDWTKVEQLVKEAPSADPVWQYHLSRMWQLRHDDARALECAKAACEQTGEDDPLYLVTYCELLLKIPGGPDKVLSITERLAAQKDAPYALDVVRGQAFAKKDKDKDKALDEFLRAMAKVDQLKADGAAQIVGSELREALGADAAITQLASRSDDRWLPALAEAYRYKEDWKQAIATLEKYLAQREADDERQAERLYLASLIYHGASASMPTLEKAEKAYLQYIDAIECTEATRRMMAYNNLACLLVDHPTSANPAKALVYSQRAYDLMGQMGYEFSVTDTQGWVLLQNGRVDEGMKLIRQAMGEKQESMAEVQYHLAEGYLRKAMPREALDLLRQAKAELVAHPDRLPLMMPMLSQRIDKAMAAAEQQVARPAATEP